MSINTMNDTNKVYLLKYYYIPITKSLNVFYLYIRS